MITSRLFNFYYFTFPFLWASISIIIYTHSIPLAYFNYFLFSTLSYVWIIKERKKHQNLITLILIFFTILLVLILKFAMFYEDRLDDGPFYPSKEFNIEKITRCDFELYDNNSRYCFQKQNKLNKISDYLEPKISLIQNNSRIWSIRLETTTVYPETNLFAIIDPKFERGILRDSISFTGCWDFGCKSGILFISKWKTPIRFYISLY